MTTEERNFLVSPISACNVNDEDDDDDEVEEYEEEEMMMMLLLVAGHKFEFLFHSIR